MTTAVQYLLTAFRRVQAFLDGNAARVGALAQSEGRKLLDQAVAQLETHGVDQSSWELEMSGHLSARRSLEHDLRAEHMNPIAKYAQARLRGVPDFAALTKSTRDLDGHALVRAARAMATAAAPHADAFTSNAFPADTVAQLAAAADKLEATIDARVNLKVNRAQATEGIDAQAKQGREAVKMLSAVIDRQFAKDRTFLAGWRSAKRITIKPGVARGNGASAPVPASPTPVTTTPDA